MQPHGKQRVAVPSDRASSSNQSVNNEIELDIADGFNEEHRDDADVLQAQLDEQLASELHVQLNGLRPRRK